MHGTCHIPGACIRSRSGVASAMSGSVESTNRENVAEALFVTLKQSRRTSVRGLPGDSNRVRDAIPGHVDCAPDLESHLAETVSNVSDPRRSRVGYA